MWAQYQPLPLATRQRLEAEVRAHREVRGMEERG
jgi:hypothetical protein